MKKDKGSGVDYGKLTAEALNRAFGSVPVEPEPAPRKPDERSKTEGEKRDQALDPVVRPNGSNGL